MGHICTYIFKKILEVTPRTPSGVAAGGSKGNASPLNFRLSKKFLLIRKFPSQNTKFGTEKPPFWRNLGAKLKCRVHMISSILNLQFCLLENCNFLPFLLFNPGFITDDTDDTADPRDWEGAKLSPNTSPSARTHRPIFSELPRPLKHHRRQ